MNIRIEKKEGFRFYGITRNVSTIDGANFELIPKIWDEVLSNGAFDQMIEHGITDKSIGVCMPMVAGDDQSFDYVIGGFSQETIEGYDNYETEEALWAVFEVIGPINPNLQNAWRWIYSDWFPANSYKHVPMPEFEIYHAGDINDESYITEIWIPIK